MTATGFKTSLVSYLLLATQVFSLISFAADDPALAVQKAAIDQANQQSQQPASGPQPGTPPETSDRSKGAGAAQALAMAGAAMAGLGCIMGLDNARKMPPGQDKNMAMMMAMQQCSQAAQSAANAAKNDDAKKAASSAPMQTAQAPKALSAETKKDENPTLPFAQEKKEEEIASTDELPEPQGLTTPNLEEPKLDNGNYAELDPGFTGKAVSISALNPIEGSKVDFNEANKNDTQTVTAPGSAGGGLLGFGRAFSPEEVKKLVAQETVSATSGKAGRGKSDGEGPLGFEGGGDKSEGGSGAFDQLLNQLMGGGAPQESLSGMGGGGDLVALPKDKASGKGPNIFEYASYRYRVATYDDGRISTQPKKQAANRTIASEPLQAAAIALKPKN